HDVRADRARCSLPQSRPADRPGIRNRRAGAVSLHGERPHARPDVVLARPRPALRRSRRAGRLGTRRARRGAPIGASEEQAETLKSPGHATAVSAAGEHVEHVGRNSEAYCADHARRLARSVRFARRESGAPGWRKYAFRQTRTRETRWVAARHGWRGQRKQPMRTPFARYEDTQNEFGFPCVPAL